MINESHSHNKPIESYFRTNSSGWQWIIWIGSDKANAHLNTYIPPDSNGGACEGDYSIPVTELTTLLGEIGVPFANWVDALNESDLGKIDQLIESFKSLASKTGRSYWSRDDW